MLLERRGLIITDRSSAKACLERIGYYRLSGYWYPLRKSRISTNPVTGRPILDSKGKETTIVEETFRPGVCFQDAMDLYVFDKKLRLIFLDAIERIEVALRVDIALLLGKRSPYAHRDPRQLDPRFGTSGTPSGFEKWLSKLDLLFERSSEQFVKHFKTKYHGSHPPIWIAVELWDFGMLSVLVSGMKVSDQQRLATKYGLSTPSLLTGFVRNINNIRNICAHHSRLWNRSPADRVPRPRQGQIPNLDHLSESSYSRVYATAAVMQHLLRSINPATSWPTRLKDHMTTLPSASGIDLSQAGFPSDWTEMPLWKTN